MKLVVQALSYYVTFLTTHTTNNACETKKKINK